MHVYVHMYTYVATHIASRTHTYHMHHIHMYIATYRSLEIFNFKYFTYNYFQAYILSSPGNCDKMFYY